VITTNQSIEGMDPRLSSRLRHEGLVKMVPMYQPDYRARTDAEGISRKLETFGSLNAYEGMTFKQFSDRRGEVEPAQSAALRKTAALLEDYAEHPMNWVLLRGGYGVGKTHLAAAVANKVTRNGMTALFVVVPDLLDHLRATFSPDSQHFAYVAAKDDKWFVVLDGEKGKPEIIVSSKGPSTSELFLMVIPGSP